MKNSSKVIHVNFVSKQVVDEPIRPLSHNELAEVESQIDAISRAMDECDSDRDADVLATLDAQLAELVSKLDVAFIAAENQERIELIKGKRRKGQKLKLVA